MTRYLVATIKVSWVLEDPDCPMDISEEVGREQLKECLDRSMDEVGGYEYVSDVVVTRS
jgi:hypothetical protein